MAKIAVTLPFIAAAASGGYAANVVSSLLGSEGLLSYIRSDFSGANFLKGSLTDSQARALLQHYARDPSAAGNVYVPLFRQLFDSNTAIQGQPVLSIMADGTVGAMPLPQGYWKLDETGAAVPVSQVGTFTGALGAGVTQGGSTMLNSQGGTSYTFSAATTSFADLTNDGTSFALTGLAPHTVAFWMRPTSLTGTGTPLLGKALSASTAGWQVLITPTSLIYRRSDGSTISSNTYTYTPPTGGATKQHVAVVYTGNVGTQSPWYTVNNTSIIFIDGQEVQRVAHTTLSGGITNDAAANVTLGNAGNHSLSAAAYVGGLDEVAIWSSPANQAALSPDQVYSLYQNGFNPPG